MNNGNGSASFDASSAAFIEALFEQYVEDPSSVPETWQRYFSSIEGEHPDSSRYISHSAIREDIIKKVRDTKRISATSAENQQQIHHTSTTKQAAVQRLINSYRLFGHMRAATDPLELRARPLIPDLDYHHHGLEDKDLGVLYNTGDLGTPRKIPLHEIIDILTDTYAGSIGVEYNHISNIDQKCWIRDKLEGGRGRKEFSVDEKKHILSMLNAAEGMETFLHRRYSGKKRFGLEGGDSLIVLLDKIIQESGSNGCEECVIGMAHRGRLNVLINIMGKHPSELMEEFEGRNDMPRDKMTGDVKYHIGYSSDVRTPGGPVHLSLAFNPSHLEIINPVIVGSCRARQDRKNSKNRSGIVPIIIHGDAAISGQGVVYESANMSGTRGYTVGGSIHVVINNQIGFTTSHPLDSRTALYCTDVGKVTQSPIFHVNADDAEAVAFVAELATEFRNMWQKDAYIDLVCYRRHGHNEGDEPSATQPVMYDKIRSHETALTFYSGLLLNDGIVDQEYLDDLAGNYRDALEKGHPVSYNFLPNGKYNYQTLWAPHVGGSWTDPGYTAIPEAELKELGRLATTIPEGFNIHRSVDKIISDRRLMVSGEQPLDWGCAENLAYASLIDDGYGVRLSGQDSCRGTFFHRHVKVHNMDDGRSHVPLAHMYPNQANFIAIDSVLSEEAVLGFEYGYATTDPRTLVVWEAQYGDFVNGAQVVIDQFISSSEQKWGLLCGLVMMLPHGWEGQGPEHSSARLERFLQLCAQENMQICVPSTAAQMFHLLRRQMIRNTRMPLIIMSPKSMLRRKESFSELHELSDGAFQPVIAETEELNPENVDRVVLCSGKVYYELLKKRTEEKLTNVAIIRVEQLYPWPYDEFQATIDQFPAAKLFVWTQEEPRNQGAWYQIQHRIRRCLKKTQTLNFVGRVPCSAPAGGSIQRHNDREKILIFDALGISETEISAHDKEAAKKSKKVAAKEPAKKKAAKKTTKKTTKKSTNKTTAKKAGQKKTRSKKT